MLLLKILYVIKYLTLKSGPEYIVLLLPNFIIYTVIESMKSDLLLF